VSSFFPNKDSLPAGLELRHQDTTAPWPSSDLNTFDLVHQRLGLFGLTSQQLPIAIAGLISVVKPGGWIQLVDADLTGPEAQPDSPMAGFVKLIKALLGKTDDSADAFAHKLKCMLGGTGLVDVHERILDARYGALNPSVEFAQKSTLSSVLASEGMVAVARSVSGMAERFELDAMVGELKKGLDERGAVMRYYVVWGQKKLV
jgi:hypothetical protein